MSASLARSVSQALVLEFVVRQASAVVLRLHQPWPMAHVLPAALEAMVPDQRSPGTCLGKGGTGTLVWLSEALGPRWPWGETVPGIPSVDFSERGTPQPPKPGQTTCIPQCPQCPRPPPHAVDLGVPYPGVLATEGEASLSHPGTPQSRNLSAPGPSLASTSMPALQSRPQERVPY